ncbi:MAG: DUF3570 domain-containing protein [Myxococcales bacterium]|nr:DUF3570 domain-containing protein [Myxococcales bacterium]
MQLRQALALIVLAGLGAVASADPAEPAPAADATSSASDTATAPGAAEADLPAADPAVTGTTESVPKNYPTGTVRVGAYHDSDRTTVYRLLGSVAQSLGQWTVQGSVGVDAVTSASVDVRSSPALSKVDVVTSASGRSSTSGGQMTDTRYQVTGGVGWKGSAGRAANVNAVVARETDYTSVSGGINGSFDVLDRTTTLLGGLTLTDNWVSSVLDQTFHHKLLTTGWSVGVARVLTRNDAIRLRYDGKLSSGDPSSPYRSVRFGDWTAQQGSQQITFMNTIGSADGLPEHLPGQRVSHAAVLEGVHWLAPGIAVHPELRASYDSWSVGSLSGALDLRIARPSWQLSLGYRYYWQRRAEFFEDKYTQAPAMYSYYTSDKELGDQRGHLGRLDLSRVLFEADDPNDGRMLLNLQLDVARYQYPGFTLLPSRDSVFVGVGLSWER